LARILIVDDVDIVRKALQIGVKKMGYEVDGTSDPRAALEMALLQPPDLALVDYRMQGMDGVEFFAALEEALGVNCPKVLFVSATPAEEVHLKLRTKGLRPSGFVKKPFHFDDLWKALQQALAA
jgi:CheY-like chemotaxis protein